MPRSDKIYHITHIRNLVRILENGFLLSQSQVQAGGISFTNIAHDTIQDRRATTSVPCGPGGTLHEYVPFYFAPRSPMLFTISRGNVQGYDEGQDPVIYLVTSMPSIIDAELQFVFTDGHGIMLYTAFYDDLDNLNQVDWDVMNSRYWADTEEDTDRRRRRQAEFLIHNKIPFQFIEEVGVINRDIKAQVETILSGFFLRPSVTVRREWYY